MAGPSSPATDNPLLRGLFGDFQAGAAARQDTASIWSTIRQSAGSWVLRAQGAAQPYDPAEAEALGRGALSDQGVNAAGVSSMRGVAGQWLGAKQRLQGLGLDQQITAGSIFVAPWASTADSSTPSRYRLRTQWQLESAAGDVFTRWKSDELETPLTTVGAALDQATLAGQQTAGHGVTLSNTEPVLLDYELEQI